jgi:bacterioferritin-associated ferredoxin
MIVCVCKAMSERAIRERIESGARTLEELARETGVTTDCGTCTATVLEMLEEAAAVTDRTDRGGHE